MSATFIFNVPEIMGNIEAANQEALVEMGQHIIADSNYYCPHGEDSLITSAENNSDLENGIIVWDTPYASYLYHGVLMVGKNGSARAKRGEKKKIKVPEQKLNFATDKNPNAQMMWYEKAKDIHGDQWNTIYKNAFKKAMKGGG